MKTSKLICLIIFCIAFKVDGQWVEKNNGLFGGNVNTLVVNGTNLFAGTDGGGVFLSTNNGSSWTAVNNGLTNLLVLSLAINGTNLFAGTDGGGVFLSTNNGSSWTAVNTGLSASAVISLTFSGTNLFAGTVGGGVFLSTNNGSSWTAVNTGLTNLNVFSLAVSGTNLFAGTSGGVFLSTNNGSSWTAVNTGLTNLAVLSLAVSGTNLFAGIPGGVFLSTNNGSSWTAVNTGLTNTYVNSLAVSGTNLFAGTRGGVFLSTNNGSSWTAVNTGLTSLDVRSFAVSGTNLFAGTTGGGVFLSTNNGSSWTAVNTGLTNLDVFSLAVNGTNLFAGTDGGVFLSANNGSNWTAVNTGLTSLNVRSFAVSGTNLFAGINGGGVFLSTNNGSSWSAVNTGLTNTAGMNSLAVSGTNLFVATNASSGVFLSTNNGSSWTAVNTGLTNLDVRSFAVSGTNLFAGTYGGGGVFLSTNNGSSWTAVNTDLTSRDVRAFAVSGTNLFAATYGGGVFLSTNNGSSWTAVNTGLTSFFVLSLAVSGTNLFAGTYGGGVWSRPLSDFLPSISSFSPTSGSVATAVTITGVNFGTAAVNNIVKFNGTIATISGTPTATSITTTVPSGATTGKITVDVGGQVATSSTNFTVTTVTSPTIASFNPTSGVVGATVTITGTNFNTTAANNIVKFNGTTATISGTPTATSITTTVPSGATTGTITVTAGGQTATSSTNFTVTSPTIASFNPTSGLVGATVTITGTNFNTTAANNIVKFNGTTAIATASTSTSITTSVPSGATIGTISVAVNSVTATSATSFVVESTPPVLGADNTGAFILSGSPISITARFIDLETDVTGVKVFYRSVTTSGNVKSLTLTKPSQDWIGTIPASDIGELGIEYKLEATNGVGLILSTAYKLIKVQSRFTVPYSSYGASPSNFRIISVPLDNASANGVFSNELGAYDKFKWRMFEYKGTTKELNGASVLKPGVGYWLIASKNPGPPLNTELGHTVTATTDNPFKVELPISWNLIGNPYNFNLSWADILNANPSLKALNTKLWTFGASGYTSATTVLKKGEGGFVLATAATNLVFPVAKNNSVNGGRIAEGNLNNENPLDADNWEIAFALNQEGKENTYSGIGMQPEALEAFDKYDAIAPPRFNDYLELNHAKTFLANSFAKDIVPTTGSHTWTFMVESSDNKGLASLEWDNSSFGRNEKEMFLFDENERVSINMRTLSSYSFRTSGKFKIIFGSSDYLSKEMPEGEGKILSVSPNPSASEMKIVVSLPGWKKNHRVNIDLINSLGQKITDVYSGDLVSGSHELLWNGFTTNGDRAASGIYFLKLLHSGGVSVYRIVLD